MKCFTALNSTSTSLYGLNIKDTDYHIDYSSNDSNVNEKAKHNAIELIAEEIAEETIVENEITTGEVLA